MYNKDFSMFEVEGLTVNKIFNVLSALYHTKLARDLNHTGLERYFSVLIVLDIIKDGCSQKLLAEILDFDEASMGSIIDELVQNGFVNRILDMDDLREYNIVLTAKAKDYVPEIKDVIHRENNKNKETVAVLPNDKQIVIKNRNSPKIIGESRAINNQKKKL